MTSKAARGQTANASKGSGAPASNFLRTVIEEDLRSGRYAQRTWSGRPGPRAVQEGAPPDAARIRTRFPPEPNGYLHYGHAKAICLNFGLARDFGGVCHMRFDDTNPAKEEQEYVDSILDAVRWLGFDWGEHLYFASDYFDTLYAFAEDFILHGRAYVDSQSAEEMRANRGTLVVRHDQEADRGFGLVLAMPARSDRRPGQDAQRIPEIGVREQADGQPEDDDRRGSYQHKPR